VPPRHQTGARRHSKADCISELDVTKSNRPVVLAHSSDLHIDDDFEPGKYHGLEGLRYVLRAAETARADVLLLAGDTFDNGRVSEPVARRAGALLAEAPMPVVLLPGNHDPAIEEGVFHRTGILELPHAFVFGHAPEDSVRFDALDLEIIGRPHLSYNNMPPMPATRPRKTRWQLAMAHGHYVPAEEWEEQSHRSWRYGDADIDAVEADYIALGHWDRNEVVGIGKRRAHYSGAPDLAQTVNLIRLCPLSGVSVERHPLDMPYPPRW
jgi:hypothetical protein